MIGGSYELNMGFRTDALEPVLAAVKALWSHPKVAPAYPRSDVEPDQQTAVDLSSAGIEDVRQLYGTCRLDGIVVVTFSTLIQYEEARQVWIYFGFPMAALGRAYPVGGYPISEAGPWRDAVDGWLAALADDVFSRAPFDCGLIGHDPETIHSEWSIAEEVSHGRIPLIRPDFTILVPTEDSLVRYPPTDESEIRRIHAGKAVCLAREILSSVEPKFQKFADLFEEIVSIEGCTSPNLTTFRDVLSASRHIRQRAIPDARGSDHREGKRQEELEVWRSCSGDICAACRAVIRRYQNLAESRATST